MPNIWINSWTYFALQTHVLRWIFGYLETVGTFLQTNGLRVHVILVFVFFDSKIVRCASNLRFVSLKSRRRCSTLRILRRYFRFIFPFLQNLLESYPPTPALFLVLSNCFNFIAGNDVVDGDGPSISSRSSSFSYLNERYVDKIMRARQS